MLLLKIQNSILFRRTYDDASILRKGIDHMFLIVGGFAVVFGLSFVFSCREQHSSFLIESDLQPQLDRMSKHDLNIWNQLRSAYEKRDAKRLNSLLFVEDGALSFELVVPDNIEAGRPFNIEISLYNKGDKRIVICRPRLKKVTLQPALLDGVYVHTYGVMWGVDGSDWCQTLLHGQRAEAILEPMVIKNEGRHRLRVSLLLPKYDDLAGSYLRATYEFRGMVEVELQAIDPPMDKTGYRNSASTRGGVVQQEADVRAPGPDLELKFNEDADGFEVSED